MRRWRTVLAILIATLWVAAGAHCRLEALAGFHFLSCEDQTEAANSPVHSEKDCGSDGCWVIESGSYQAQKPLTAPAKPLLALVAGTLALPDLTQEASSGLVVTASPAPPELSRLWQFSRRTALPPRAPTFLS
jgi:hypothetical protein